MQFNFSKDGYFKIFLNTSLSNYSIIAETLLKHDIEVTKMNPFPDKNLPAFCMTVPENHASFEDSYNLVLLLSNFGLQYVHWGVSNILIGTTDCILDWRLVQNEYMPVGKFLKLNPKMTIEEVLEKYRYSLDEIDETEFDNQEEFEENYIDEDDNDYERDTFDAITDGQLGNYDDYEGDIDDAMTWAGRD